MATTKKYLDEAGAQAIIDQTKARLALKADAANTYTKSEVDDKVNAVAGRVYKFGGTKVAADLVADLLVQANNGLVYNISDKLTTTALFVEGAGNVYGPGANVAVAEVTPASEGVDAVYKFDVLGDFIDMSDVVFEDDMESITSEDITTMFKDAGTITLSKESSTISEASGTDTVTVTAASGTISAVSADVEVATVVVDNEGVNPIITITAVAAGETEIVVTSAETATTRAAVKNIAVTCSF